MKTKLVEAGFKPEYEGCSLFSNPSGPEKSEAPIHARLSLPLIKIGGKP
jgi:hypothetical protein